MSWKRGANAGRGGYVRHASSCSRWATTIVRILLDVPGEDLPHVRHYYDEAHNYYRKRVVIVGGKNSAVEAALELYRSGAQVTLVHRGPALGDSVKYWVKPDIENRIKEGSDRGPVQHTGRRDPSDRSGRRSDARGSRDSGRRGTAADRLSGRPRVPAARRRRGSSAETNVPRHDPMTFETNVPNLFIAGGQQAGKKTGTVFIENGRFHGVRIAEVARASGCRRRIELLFSLQRCPTSSGRL